MSKYLITIAEASHGVISAHHDGADQQYCEAGDTVTIQNQPMAGWGLQALSYTDANNSETAIDVDNPTFTMPSSAITINAVFKKFVVGDWTEGRDPNTGDMLVVGDNGEPVAGGTLLENLGFDEFDTTTAYEEGDIVLHNGTLYIFTEDHSAGAWTGDDAESLTVAEVLEMLSHQNDVYGVSYDETLSTPAKPRVGNLALHQTLPVQSGMRRCVLKDDGTVNYYLDASDSTLQEDGTTAAVLDGTDGQVMVEVPEHWRKVTKDGDVVTAMISAYWQKGWKHIPTYYVGAYQATVDTTTASKLKLCSVLNTSDEFRGGNNNAEWDDTYRDQRGTPRTALSMANYRTYARNRGSNAWNFWLYDMYIDIYWLYVIEYANTNSQADFDSSLTAEGYKQGGLGAGATTLNSSKWSAFNSYYPFLQCGLTNSLGNASGVVAYTMPEEYDSDNTVTVSVCSYRGIENVFGQVNHWLEGIKFNDDKTYRCADASAFSSAASQGDYVLEGAKGTSDGDIKGLTIGDDGSIIPESVGGGSTTYYCDYYYRANAGTSTWYGCAVGGHAFHGTNAGLGCVSSDSSVTTTSASFGSRLCFCSKLA